MVFINENDATDLTVDYSLWWWRHICAMIKSLLSSDSLIIKNTYLRYACLGLKKKDLMVISKTILLKQELNHYFSFNGFSLSEQLGLAMKSHENC